MKFLKNYFLLLCCLIFQNAFFAQFYGVSVRAYNVLPVQKISCTAANGEVFKTFIENDSLYFETSTGLTQAVAPAKNKGGPSLNNLPGIACDNSNGQFKNRIYICWSSEKNGLKNKDVFIVYSDDKGKNWTDPVLVTYRPNHRAQVMPVILVDQATGGVYLLYYDNQNYFENVITTDVYLAISNNGGLKFDCYKLNSEPLNINLNTQSRNYLKLNSENGLIIAGWNQNGKQKTPLTTIIINDTFLANYNKNTNEISFEKTVNFLPEIKINLRSSIDTKLTAAITKPLLPGFEKLVVKNFEVKTGGNQLVIDTKKLGLQKGNYVLTLYYNSKNDFIWITEE